MNSRFRGIVVLICCIVILFCSFAFQWFIIKYQPTGGYAPRYFYFSFADLIGHYKDVSSIKFVYAQLGWVALLGLTSTFLEGWIQNQIKSFIDIVTFALTFFNTVHDKAIITQLDPQTFKSIFGTNDVAYVLHNSTTQISMGYIATIVATIIISLVLAIPSDSMSVEQLNGIPGRKYAIALAACSVIMCCTLSTIAALSGATTTTFEFYDKSHFVTVSSTLGWQDTKLVIKKGDIVYLLYVPHAGTWTAHKQNAASYTDAKGDLSSLATETAHSKLPLYGFPVQALIGKIGNNSPFLVGNGDSFLASDDGALSLRMNQSDGALASDAGTIEEQITIVRYVSGFHLTFTKVTLPATSGWHDTAITASANSDVFSMSYIYGSGTMAHSNTLVAPDAENGVPPDFTFILQGFDTNFPYTYTGQGLSAKFGTESPFYCGFGTLARPKPDATSSAEGDHLYLSILNAGSAQGSIQVFIGHMTLDSVSTYNYV
jgi:hypothetical protein